MCIDSNDFTGSTVLGADAGYITCNTLNSFLLSKFTFYTDDGEMDWKDPCIDCASVLATEWTNGADKMHVHLYHFGPSCCGGSKAKVRYTTCGTARKLVQDVTITSITQADYVDDVKLVYEGAYASSIGIWDTSLNAVKAGCTVTSAAIAVRRAGITITFTANVDSDNADDAKVAAEASGFNSVLVSAVSTVNTALGKSVTAPTLASVTVTAPVATAATNGNNSDDSDTGVVLFILIGIGIVLSLGVLVGIGTYVYSAGDEKTSDSSTEIKMPVVQGYSVGVQHNDPSNEAFKV